MTAACLFEETRNQRRALNASLKKVFADTPRFAAELGLDPKLPFEVHELRRSIRVAPNGRHVPQIIGALTQSRRLDVRVPDGRGRGSKGSSSPSGKPHVFRGGST